MLHSTIGTIILNGLFAMNINRNTDGTAVDGQRQDISFSGDVYLGLLTKLPNANGTPYANGGYFAEPADAGYMRIKIDTKSRITKANFIAPAETDETTYIGEDKAVPAYVVNQGAIMFPEASVTWDKIVGFGLFRSDNTGDNTTLPFLWGSVTTESGEEGVYIEQHEVPIIRTGGFKVSLV